MYVEGLKRQLNGRAVQRSPRALSFSVGLPRSDSPPKSETERRWGRPAKMKRRKRRKRPALQGSSPAPRESRRRAAFRSGGSAAAVLGSLARLRAGRQGADAPPSAPCGPIQQNTTRARRHGCRCRPGLKKRSKKNGYSGQGWPWLSGWSDSQRSDEKWVRGARVSPFRP